MPSRVDAQARIEACLGSAAAGSAVFVSACLLGKRCRYDASDARNPAVLRFVELLRGRGVSVRALCPECAARLDRPREPAELREGGRVVARSGIDVTERFAEGAARTVSVLSRRSPLLVVLKSKSPSCGLYEVYDGTFTATLRPGFGVAAAALAAAGWALVDERDVEAFDAAANRV